MPRRSEIAVDRKSTRLNSSHVEISYAVFCLKKKTDVHFSPDTVLGRCSELLLELIQAQGATSDQILGIGIGVSCPVDFFFFNDTATTEIYTLSLHDALPI